MSVYIVAGRMISADSECALEHGFPYRELRGHVQTRDGKPSMITYEMYGYKRDFMWKGTCEVVKVRHR
jgi:hypothetical protein